jgi:hypothetical protein
MANAPIDKIVVGNVALTIWENVVGKGKDSFKSFSINIQKNYKDKDGTWKQTGSFKYSELPYITLAVEEALRRKYLRQNEIGNDTEVSFED